MMTGMWQWLMEVGCALRAQNSMEATNVLDLISVFAYWNLGRWINELFAQQSGKKKALNHWVIASQGAAFLPQLFGFVGLGCWVFHHMQWQVMSTGCFWRLWKVDLSLFSPCSLQDREQPREGMPVPTHGGITQSMALPCNMCLSELVKIYFNMDSSRHRILWICASKALGASTKAYFPNLVYDLLKSSLSWPCEIGCRLLP